MAENPAPPPSEIVLACGCKLTDEGITITLFAVCHSHISKIRQAVALYKLGLLKV